MSDPRYRHRHQQIRKQWQTRIDQAGTTQCHATRCLMPTRTIHAGEPWDLGHTPCGTRYTGPEHPRCNRSEGATRGNQNRRNTPTTPPPRGPKTSREW